MEDKKDFGDYLEIAEDWFWVLVTLAAISLPIIAIAAIWIENSTVRSMLGDIFLTDIVIFIVAMVVAKISAN